MRILSISSAFYILNRHYHTFRKNSLSQFTTNRVMSEFTANDDSSHQKIIETTIITEQRVNLVDDNSKSDLSLIPEVLKRSEDGFLIYWHPDCFEHNIPDHPEQQDRVAFVLNKLKTSYNDEYFRQAPLVSAENILLFHTPRLLEIFTKIATYVEDAHSKKQYAYKRIDDDTVVMWKTRDAAFRAAGAMIQAIDDVFSSPIVDGNIKTAFCCVRPPGHHAERHRSMGFCYFNNVGIGAKYAQSKYGLGKVAVIDFDVHHGNGTEEGFKEDESLFFGSTHEKDNYPGTGQDPSPHIGEKAQNPLHRRIVNRCLSSGNQSRVDFKKKWQEVVDEMILFKPELIIISAGFDAHDQDPLSGTKLIEEDFAWATKIVVDASRAINASNPPPIISSLEGGYNLHFLAKSALAHANVLSSCNQIPIEEKEDGEDIGYGGDEAKALAAHIASLDINK